MTGKISEDLDKVVDGTEKLAAASGGSNYGILVSSIAAYLRAVAEILTNKTINAANNTISGLTTAMFAANVVDTDTTLAANSDTRIASQKAVKAYADALIAANDAMVFKGAIDCSANPNYPAANRGDTYRVSVAGKIGGASGVVVESGDIAICNADATSAGDQATVGASWNVIQTNIDGAVTGPASATSGNLPKFNGASGKVLQDSGVAISTDGTFAANSDAKVPTEKAVKTFHTVENLSGAAWSTWSPSFTTSTVGGTPITAAVSGTGARYKQIGKTVFFTLDATISNVGSGNNGQFIVSLPVNAANASAVLVGSGKEAVTIGKLLGVQLWSATQVAMGTYDNLSLISGGNGTRVLMGGFYEAA